MVAVVVVVVVVVLGSSFVALKYNQIRSPHHITSLTAGCFVEVHAVAVVVAEDTLEVPGLLSLECLGFSSVCKRFYSTVHVHPHVRFNRELRDCLSGPAWGCASIGECQHASVWEVYVWKWEGVY